MRLLVTNAVAVTDVSDEEDVHPAIPTTQTAAANKIEKTPPSRVRLRLPNAMSRLVSITASRRCSSLARAHPETR